VLRRRKVLGKLGAKAEGPFEVFRVTGKFHQQVWIRPLPPTLGSRRQRPSSHLVVHASQLVPYVSAPLDAQQIEEGDQTAIGAEDPTLDPGEPPSPPNAPVEDPSPAPKRRRGRPPRLPRETSSMTRQHQARRKRALKDAS
jgi:hypothetical protein